MRKPSEYYNKFSEEEKRLWDTGDYIIREELDYKRIFAMLQLQCWLVGGGSFMGTRFVGIRNGKEIKTEDDMNEERLNSIEFWSKEMEKEHCKGYKLVKRARS